MLPTPRDGTAKVVCGGESGWRRVASVTVVASVIELVTSTPSVVIAAPLTAPAVTAVTSADTAVCITVAVVIANVTPADVTAADVTASGGAVTAASAAVTTAVTVIATEATDGAAADVTYGAAVTDGVHVTNRAPVTDGVSVTVGAPVADEAPVKDDHLLQMGTCYRWAPVTDGSPVTVWPRVTDGAVSVTIDSRVTICLYGFPRPTSNQLIDHAAGEKKQQNREFPSRHFSVAPVLCGCPSDTSITEDGAFCGPIIAILHSSHLRW